MAILYYDFDRSSNGSGASMEDARNTWATPGNGDVIRIKPGNRWLRATQLNFSTFTGLTIEPWPTYYDGGLPKPIITHTAASTFAWNFVGDGVHKIRDLRFEDCATNTNGGVVGAGTVAATSVGAQLDIQRCDFVGCNWNAIRLSATGAAASPTFKANHNTFLRIGEDCVYGGALVYEFGHNDCRQLSTNTDTGDAVGFFNVVPTHAWVHHNYVDHGFDGKQCIIIDSSTTDAGLAIIEFNELIGFGDEDNSPLEHTIINGDARMIVRWNRIRTAGIALNLAGNDSEAYGNRILVRNRQASAPNVIALVCSGTTVRNNTLLATKPLDTGWAVTQATGETGNIVQNNLIVGLPGGIRTSGGDDPTVSHNAMWQVGTAYSGGSLAPVNDVTTDPLITSTGRPLPGSQLLTAGADLGLRRDINGVQGRKFIGAYTAAAMRPYVT